MDCQALLEKQARDRGLALTPLQQMNRYSQSQKIPCCGGVVVRVETESSADSTVCLRDDSGTCFCALHGDLTSHYPDVLTAGALLCLSSVTLLITSAKMPPLLVACLDNLTGLMLPDEDAADDPTSTRASDRMVLLGPPVSLAAAWTDHTDGTSSDSHAIAPSKRPRSPSPVAIAEPEAGFADARGPHRTAAAPPPPPCPQAAPLPPAAAAVKAETVSDDDEDCLELADDL